MAHTHEPVNCHHTENYSARRHPEFVVLEIGEEIGALIVHTDASMHGVEIEISATGEDAHRSHKEVLERSINEETAFTAVFDGLKAGTYTLWTDDTPRARLIAIEGGAVAQLDWRTSAYRRRC
jgi:hypothetical protein